MIVVGLSVVTDLISTEPLGNLESVLVLSVFLLVSLSMAVFDSVDGVAVLLGDSVTGADVEIAVIELIILSIIDTGFSVVPSFTLRKKCVMLMSG